jgi:hypothetical protein
MREPSYQHAERCQQPPRRPTIARHPTGTPDPLVLTLRRHGLPVTRENYLALAYPTGLPEPWTAELEAELPPDLQEPLELSEEEEAWRKHRQRQRELASPAYRLPASREDHSR